MKKLILFVSLFAFGCATTHPGNGAHSLNPEGDSIKISADPVNEYTDKSNVFLDFTLENTGTRWMKIDQVAIEFPNESNVVHNVIVGDDLRIWAESVANKKRIEDQNATVGAAALVLTGMTVALVGAVRGDKGLATAGLAATAGGGAWQTAREFKASKFAAERSTNVPETYLLAPMTIPSGGVLRRWILVNIPQGLIAKQALLTLRTIEGDTLRYEVPIVFRN